MLVVYIICKLCALTGCGIKLSFTKQYFYLQNGILGVLFNMKK